jgi:ribosomal protein S18 acetylase RimI-like enzyme
MKITSLGYKTNFIFAKFSGSIIDQGDYTLIKTPKNPGYYWGNFIVFDKAPVSGDYKKWKNLFDKEFSYYKEPHHYAFTWDTEAAKPEDINEFIDNNFDLDTEVVLTTSRLNPPPHVNEKLELRKIKTDEQWQQIIDLQVASADPKYMNEDFEKFKQEQMSEYRSMSEAGHGFWFGGYIDDLLVGDMGLFYEGDIGRYQSVGTHPEHRRKGVCGTMVYKVGQLMQADFNLRNLVMVADENYHAARIYESVGFKKTETQYALTWWHSKSSN